MKYSAQSREEELKLKIAKDFFSGFDTTPIIGNIDFCVAVAGEQGFLFNQSEADYIENLLWAEAKKDVKTENGMYESLVQLILTIGKARTFDRYLPPMFLGAFDAEKIAFIPYDKIMAVFSQNDFNWNVTPSDHETKEFLQLFAAVKEILEAETLAFRFDDEKVLGEFIKKNFVLGNRDFNRVSVNKNNFVTVYGKWLATVQPTIKLDWQGVKKYGILDADFFLADLLSEDNSTIIEKLFVLLKSNHYELDRKVDEMGFEESKRVAFSDGQKAHKKFWAHYNRPPKEEYWGYIVERRDLLVPQDVRERKSSFFTPQKWVELSQKYIADVLGENWQDEYYVWDCAAGTGNLLAGLTNKYRIYASTLDKADVEVMKERIANGANLLESHVFQFDFLNDDLQGEKVPESLRKILADENERKKLLMYINPPYAEAANQKQIAGTGINKTNVAVQMKSYEKYLSAIGIAGRELFAQFFTRIYFEIHGCVLAEFSKTKHLQSPNFEGFRNIFRAKLEKCFLVPGNSFDNVIGKFPIGFFVWNTGIEDKFSEVNADVFNNNVEKISLKKLFALGNYKSINDWIIETRNRTNEKAIGYMSAKGADFQNQNFNFIINSKEQLPHPRGTLITDKNLIEIAVYIAVRQCIEATWINDRDQFLYPADSWQTDFEFQTDCLVYTLFHGQNRISGVSTWCPFTESELDAKDAFESHFMSGFINGKIKPVSPSANSPYGELFSSADIAPQTPDSGQPVAASLSPEAAAVMHSARKLYRYYHAQPHVNVNAGFYDIRAYFQGKDANGRMNSTSPDDRYNALLADLRAKQKPLAAKIAQGVYAHGFLKG